MSCKSDLTIAEELLNLMPYSDRDRSIIFERVFCSSTLEQLTKKYKISGQRIWQIEKKFLISTVNNIYINPHSAIRIALDIPVKIEGFSVLDWYVDIGVQHVGEFPEEARMFFGRCVFECFLLLLKKINSLKGYGCWKLNIQNSIADYLPKYQIYYQASPIREHSTLGEVSEYIWRFTKKYGLVPIDYVASRLDYDKEITMKALQMDGYVEFYEGWYLHKNVMMDQRSIFNLSLVKMFNVVDRISIREVYKGLSRSLQWRDDIKPDIELLEKLLISYGFTIQGKIVFWDKARNNRIALSKAEQSLVRAARKNGPVFSINEMKLYLEKDGISANNIWNYVANKSPIFISINSQEDSPGYHRIIGSDSNIRNTGMEKVLMRSGDE